MIPREASGQECIPTLAVRHMKKRYHPTGGSMSPVRPLLQSFKASLGKVCSHEVTFRAEQSDVTTGMGYEEELEFNPGEAGPML